MPFLELMTLVGCRAKDRARGIAGIGLVKFAILSCLFMEIAYPLISSGVECMVSVSIPTIKGGAASELGVRKGLRAMEIAEQNRLPYIALIETVSSNRVLRFVFDF